MLFNSFTFLLFLPIVFLLYWFVFNRSLRWQNALVLAASYFFYGWWSWKFMGLLMFSTLLDYAYAFGVASTNRKKARLFLWLSIINNLGILGLFKYYNFFALQFSQGLAHLGIHTDPLLLQVALPIGISFYTFHGMSYVFDIYRGVQKPVENVVDYAVFVSFFPLLVAGPIERANHLLPQVQKGRIFNYAQAVEGCRLILWGLFKKVVVADSLATMVNAIFSNYPQYNAIHLISGAIAFSFQIYGDFSGYSDIAIGVAKLFGFEVLSNFKFPYFSRNIAEFWRRWHISLSSWFRDYLYIPLGGSKDGKWKAVRNIFIIFLVSGFWHGANWKFIIWGAIHACAFLPLLLLGQNRKYVNDVVAQNKKLPDLKELGQMTATFAFVTLAWIFFRADGIQTAIGYIQHIVSSSIHDPGQYVHLKSLAKWPQLCWIVPMVGLDWTYRRNERVLNRNSKLLMLLLASLVLWGLLNELHREVSFIYFQF